MTNIKNKTDLEEIQIIAEAMSEKKAKNIVSLDLRPVGNSIADYFVICNADSTTQVGAICDNIQDRMHEKCRISTARQQGRENSFWIILDYTTIVVHIFQTEYRDFYRLEDLWADAPKTFFESGDE